MIKVGIGSSPSPLEVVVASHLTGDLIGIGMGCGRRCTTELNGTIVWCIGSVMKDDITDTDAAHRAAVIARSNAMVEMEYGNGIIVDVDGGVDFRREHLLARVLPVRDLPPKSHSPAILLI